MPLERLHHGSVADYIAGNGGKAVGENLIDGGVFPGNILGLWVNIHARGVGRAEQNGGDR